MLGLFWLSEGHVNQNWGNAFLCPIRVKIFSSYLRAFLGPIFGPPCGVYLTAILGPYSLHLAFNFGHLGATLRLYVWLYHAILLTFWTLSRKLPAKSTANPESYTYAARQGQARFFLQVAFGLQHVGHVPSILKNPQLQTSKHFKTTSPSTL